MRALAEMAAMTMLQIVEKMEVHRWYSQRLALRQGYLVEGTGEAEAAAAAVRGR